MRLRYLLAARRQPESTVLQPVGGEVGINARVINNRGKIDDETKSQRQAGQRGSEKESGVLANEREHVGNISRIVNFLSWR